MNRKLKNIFIIFPALVVAATTIAFASYKIATIPSNNIEISDEIPEIFNKITFKDTQGNIVDSTVLKNGESLNSSNVPLFGSQAVTWEDENVPNNTVLDLTDKNKNIFKPTSDMVLKAKVKAPSKNLDGNINVNNTSPTGNTVVVPQIDTKNDIKIGGALDGVTVTTQFKDKMGAQSIETDFTKTSNTPNGKRHVNKTNGDDTIGLEDPDVLKDDKYHHNCGTAVNKENSFNRCVSRLVLDSDLIITNSTLNISAFIGFYSRRNTVAADTGYEFSQVNMQGYIIGNYSEIDLNGHNLIVGNKGTLNAFGSVTNSIPNQGKIIVENGGKLNATFVVESQNGEREFPVQYFVGGELFSSYRMPYLNCDVRINQGGTLSANMKMCFGGGKYYNCSENVINIFGPSNSIITTSGNGYIDRKVSYDMDAYKYANPKNSFIGKNIMHQRINYEFHNINMVVDTLIEKSKIGDNTFNLDFGRNGYMIAPYFSLNLYNSTLKTKINLTFLPGSNLYVDSNSAIILSSTNLRTIPIPLALHGGFGLADFVTQNAGGLNFVKERGDYQEAVSNFNNSNYAYGWVDDVHDSKGHGRNGSSTLIHLSGRFLTSYYNHTENRKAKCILNGTMRIEDPSPLNANLKHYIGGEIDIKDVPMFIKNLSPNKNVQFCSTAGQFGPCTSFNVFFNQNGRSEHITDYYIYPVISYGNVLTDATNYLKVRDNWQIQSTYDQGSGLITQNGKKYAFIHTNKNGTMWNGEIKNIHNLFYGTNKENFYNGADKGNMYDSYFGNYYEVIENSDHTITAPIDASNKKDYIFFRGAFMPTDKDANGNRYVYIDKLVGESSDLEKTENQKRVSIGKHRLVKYKTDNFYTHPVWRLS